MTLRIIEQGDLEKLLSLYTHLHANDVVASQENIRNAWKMMFNNNCFQCFVIEKDDLLVASCNISVIPNLTRGARPLALIENVVTHSDYQNLGLGKKIMQQAISHAREHNCYKVMLLSNVNRKDSHIFYSRLGFRSDDKIGFVQYL